MKTQRKQTKAQAPKQKTKPTVDVDLSKLLRRLERDLEVQRGRTYGDTGPLDAVLHVSLERRPSPRELLKLCHRASLSIARLELAAARVVDVQARVGRAS